MTHPRFFLFVTGALLLSCGSSASGGCAREVLRESLVGTPQPGSLREAFDGLAGPHAEADVRLVSDNFDAWVTRWAAVDAATSSIETTTFIVDDDLFGMAFVGHLYRKARDGVHVRLLVDARGSMAMIAPFGGRDALQELVRVDGDVHIFNPPEAQIWNAISSRTVIPLVSSTHNKLLIVDGARAITGGRNIAWPYFVDDARRSDGATSVADADVLVAGDDTVRALQDAMLREFYAWQKTNLRADVVNLRSWSAELLMINAAMDAWLRARVPRAPIDDAVAALEREAIAAVPEVPVDGARMHVRGHLRELAALGALYGALPRAEGPHTVGEAVVISATARAQRDDAGITDAFVRLIGGAQRRIVLQSPYFILTPRVLRAFQLAAERGVEIRLLTNSPLSTDNPWSQSLFVDSWPELIARIPTLRVFAADDTQMLHAKRAVFDDDVTWIGSYNLDPFSMHVNSESVVVTWSSAFAAQNLEEIEHRIATRALEYRVARHNDGSVQRRPVGKPGAGRVIVVSGPADQVGDDVLEDLQRRKDLVLAFRSAWDFEVVVW